MNFVFKKMPKGDPNVPHDYAAERQQNASRPAQEPKNGITVTTIAYNGIDGERITPVKPNGKVIWYIHGGGFTTGSAAERRAITLYLAEKYGFTVVANNYRLAPENKWPAGLDDCISFYDGLLDAGYDPDKLYFMGESAGGHLVLSVALRLKDEGKALPKGIISFSPVTDQAEDLPSHKGNAATDYMLGDAVSSDGQLDAVFGDAWRGDEDFLKQPYISPYYGDYTGLPPIFLAASDYETLYDDSVVLYDKLTEEGHICRLDVVHGVCHAYPMFPFMPEAKKTIKKAVDFIENC